MADILIENNGPPHDGGDLSLVEGIDEVKQHIKTALYTFSKDWVLDRSKGINYPYGMRNTDFLETEVRSQILGVSGVESIENFSLQFNRENLNIQITAVVKTVYGNLTFSEEIYNN